MALTKQERKDYEKKLEFLLSKLHSESGSDAKETQQEIAWIENELA